MEKTYRACSSCIPETNRNAAMMTIPTNIIKCFEDKGIFAIALYQLKSVYFFLRTANPNAPNPVARSRRDVGSGTGAVEDPKKRILSK